MLKLPDRLQKIADFIEPGESIADIGTDHGFLPIYLYETGKSPHVILSDIKKGPLEKAKENINKYDPDKVFDIRLGSGLLSIDSGEVDTIVIAGMGGLLIADILGTDQQKSKSYQKFILQPRNAQDKLRRWLLENDFLIQDETLVKEGKYICEIILAMPITRISNRQKEGDTLWIGELDFEFSPILFKNKDPLLAEFIENKIRIEKKIIKDVSRVTSSKNHYILEESEQRIISLQKLLERCEKDGYQF